MKHKMRSPEIHLLRYTNSKKYLVVDMGLRPPDDNLLIGMHVDASRDVLSLAIFSFFWFSSLYERHGGGGAGRLPLFFCSLRCTRHVLYLFRYFLCTSGMGGVCFQTSSFSVYFLRTSGIGGGGGVLPDFLFLFSFPCSADHEQDCQPYLLMPNLL